MPRDTNSFAKRYLERSTEDLRLLAESGELTEEAQAAIEAELDRRDVRIKTPTRASSRKPVQASKRRPTRPELLESEVSKANLTATLPSPEFGYLLAAMTAIFGLIPAAFLLTSLTTVVAILYWLVCVALIHYSVKKWTRDQYSVGPILSVLLHFIPLFHLLWIFLWPGFLGSELRARGFRPKTGAYMGFFIILGGMLMGGSEFLPILFYILFQYAPHSWPLGFLNLFSTLGVFILFSVISTINSDLREVQATKTPMSRRKLAKRRRAPSIRWRRLPPRPGRSLNTARPRRWPRKFRIVYLQPDSRFAEKLRRWP